MTCAPTQSGRAVCQCATASSSVFRRSIFGVRVPVLTHHTCTHNHTLKHITCSASHVPALCGINAISKSRAHRTSRVHTKVTDISPLQRECDAFKTCKGKQRTLALSLSSSSGMLCALIRRKSYLPQKRNHKHTFLRFAFAHPYRCVCVRAITWCGKLWHCRQAGGLRWAMEFGAQKGASRVVCRFLRRLSHRAARISI